MTVPTLPAARGRPPAIDASLGHAVSRRFHALVPGQKLPFDLALSDSHRLLLGIRATHLDESLRPAPEKTALIAISGVLGVLSSRNPDTDDAAVQRRAYWAAMNDVPGFAVIEACAAALRRGIGDKRFAPTPPELREAALNLAHAVRVERARIAAVLGADVADAPSSPERRRELAAAARRAFHIPEGGLSETQVSRYRPGAGPDSLAPHARRLAAEARAMRDVASSSSSAEVAA